MMKSLILAFVLIMLALPVRAEPIPEYVLQKDFENCMGGESIDKDPDRATYCKCVGDSMRGWDSDTYANLAIQQAKLGSQQIPEQIEAIGKECIDKMLK